MIWFGIALAILALAGVALAKNKPPKPGPLTGTWECVSHGSSRGDMPFTLFLEQSGETVGGSVTSPIGGTNITSATFKKKVLEIRLETDQGTYVLAGKYKKGKLTGDWTHDPEKGTWEGTKQVEAKR
jgi:hypothetical protein